MGKAMLPRTGFGAQWGRPTLDNARNGGGGNEAGVRVGLHPSVQDGQNEVQRNFPAQSVPLGSCLLEEQDGVANNFAYPVFCMGTHGDTCPNGEWRVVMEAFNEGLADAWGLVASFVPKFVAFLVILVVGWFIARAIAKVLDKVLERVGFDRAVQRGGVGRALANSRYDASSLLSKVVFYALMLFVLQLSFGIWGPNPVSNMIQAAIGYLPNVFAAIVIVVVGAAIAAAVKEIIEASLGGLSYGRGLALGASVAIMVITAFAALDQLNIAENIVGGLFYAILAIVVGSAVVAVGGGGIHTMRRYWERAANRADLESSVVRHEARGSQDRIRERAQARMGQASGRETASPSGKVREGRGRTSTSGVRTERL
jgi:hypothetical protein